MSLFKNDNFTKSMKTFTFILLLTVASFGFGFAYKTIIVNQNKNASNMKKVTGIGGIFFKCKDPKKWQNGTKNTLVWRPIHMGPLLNGMRAQTAQKSTDPVDSICRNNQIFWAFYKRLYDKLQGRKFNWTCVPTKNEGVTILDNIETYDYGKFVHILDAEGNKIQLWEPTGE